MKSLSRLLPLICLTILIAIAGCSAGPFSGSSQQNQPVELVLDNSANVTQTFEVWTVEAGSNVTSTLNDGRTGHWTISQGIRTHGTGEYYYTSIEPPKSARHIGRYTLKSGEEKQRSIKKFRGNSAVVVVLYQGDKIGWWASAQCSDGALVAFGATSRPSKNGGDAHAGYRCDNSLF